MIKEARWTLGGRISRGRAMDTRKRINRNSRIVEERKENLSLSRIRMHSHATFDTVPPGQGPLDPALAAGGRGALGVVVMRPAGRNLFPLSWLSRCARARAHECEAWRVISHKRGAAFLSKSEEFYLSLCLPLPRAYQTSTFQPANGLKFPWIDVFLVVITREIGDTWKIFRETWCARWYSIKYVNVFSLWSGVWRNGE